MEDITRFDRDLFALNDFRCFTAYDDDNGFAFVVVVVGDLAMGNEQAEHSTEVLSVMFIGQNFGPIRLARIWIFLIDIFLCLNIFIAYLLDFALEGGYMPPPSLKSTQILYNPGNPCQGIYGRSPRGKIRARRSTPLHVALPGKPHDLFGSKRCSSARTSTIPTTRPFFNNAWTVEGKAPKNASGRMETSPPMSTGIPTTI